jgi:hypothetical protein
MKKDLKLNGYTIEEIIKLRKQNNALEEAWKNLMPKLHTFIPTWRIAQMLIPIEPLPPGAAVIYDKDPIVNKEIYFEWMLEEK